jgi:hypothetical protein
MWQRKIFSAYRNNTIKQFISIVLVLFLVQVPDVLAQYDIAEPEVYLQSVEQKEAEAQSVFRARLKLAGESSIFVTSILLDPLSEQERKTIRSAIERQDTTKKRKIGIGRSVPSPYCDAIDPGLFHWISLPEGGRAAVFSVKSPEAAALRVEIKIIHMPKGAELRFYNPTNPEEVYGPHLIDQIRGQMVDDSFWSPVIESNSIAIEIFLPKGLDCDDLSIAIPQVSHLWSSILNPYGERRLSEIGASGYCNVDVACTNWAGSLEQQSVAKMLFTEGRYTYLCTGTALNDKDPSTYIPYFLTSYHCISTQAAASSLITYWNFQKSSCYGPNPSTVTQLTGGAKLLSTGSSTDYTLLRLYQNLPSGTAFAGWTDVPVDYGSEVVGIHHPQGDLKKISFGTAQGFLDCTSGDQYTCSWGDGGYIAVKWYSGVTERGSSGSALFDDQGHVIGTLKGGASSCQEPYLLDDYGRFDRTYPLIKQWIGETSASDTTSPDTSIAFGPSGIIDYSNVVFTWTGSDDVTSTSNLVYSYRLDGYDSNWSDYTSSTSKSYNDLSNGSYTFYVKAKDEAGNIDYSPASRSFTVDLYIPDTTPSDTSIRWWSITINDVSFTYTGSDDVTQTSNLLYSYKLEGYDSDWSDYSSATSKTYNGLPNNSYTFKVRTKDEAGNIDPSPASQSFTVNVSSDCGPEQAVPDEQVVGACDIACQQGAPVKAGTQSIDVCMNYSGPVTALVGIMTQDFSTARPRGYYDPGFLDGTVAAGR